MKSVSGESLKLLAKAARSPLFQAFSWAMRILTMLSSWRLAVWRGSGGWAGRKGGARRAKTRATGRSLKRSVIEDLGGTGLFGGAMDHCFLRRAWCPVGLIVDDW